MLGRQSSRQSESWNETDDTCGGTGYDAQGNVANKDGVLFDFDQSNRLDEVTCNGARVEKYHYDALGRRVTANSPPGNILSQYDRAGLLRRQTNDRAGFVVDHYYLGDDPVAQFEDAISGGAHRTRAAN